MTDDLPSDAFGIAANVTRPDSCLRLGAKVWIESIPGNPDNMRVRGLSRGGRRIEKWVNAKHSLGNFRVAWMPPKARLFCPTFPTREAALHYLRCRVEESRIVHD